MGFSISDSKLCSRRSISRLAGAVWGDEVLTGASGKQAYNNLWISYLDPKAYTGGLKVSGDRYNETEMAKKYGGDTAKFYRLSHAIEDK